MTRDKIKDGGPAFPWREEDGEGGYDQHRGMSLRDYFAGLALQPARQMLTSEALYRKDGTELPPARVKGYHFGAIELAERAYTIADAMLAARNEKP